MKSYIKYEFDGEIFFKDMSGCTLDQTLCQASYFYAFDDCTDITVLEVVHDGMRYEYDGWEPGMTYTFRNEFGTEVFSRSFPQWDH